MSLILEVKRPAILFKEHSVGLDIRLTNRLEGYKPHSLAVQAVASFLADTPPETVGEETELTDSTEAQLQLSPIDAVQDVNLKLVLRNEIGGIMQEEYTASLCCRVRKVPENLSETKVQINGDIRTVIGLPEKEVSLIKLDQCKTKEELIDLAIREAKTDFERLSWESFKIFPQDFTNSREMRLIGVQSGAFVQGSSTEELKEFKKKAAEKPEGESSRRVEMNIPFWLSETPVTQEQWEAVMKVRSSKFPQYEGDDYPVTCISWYQASEYCQMLTKREHEEGNLPEFLEYCLPTEAQWEYACKAGGYSQQYGELRKIAVCEGRMKEVGSRSPNAWGFKDILGNVNEWCRDSYCQHYSNTEIYNPFFEGDVDEVKVLRGGCYQEQDPNFRIRAAFRQYSRPETTSGKIGFRVALVDRRQRAH